MQNIYAGWLPDGLCGPGWQADWPAWYLNVTYDTSKETDEKMRQKRHGPERDFVCLSGLPSPRGTRTIPLMQAVVYSWGAGLSISWYTVVGGQWSVARS